MANMATLEPCQDNPDVIINGHPEDRELIKFLTEGIVKEGLSVWFPVENNEKDVSILIPQAKVFIVVLSPAALTLDILKDDIALAYMANVAIFPTSTKAYRKLNELIDGGLRLMLSRIQWTFFLKPEHMEPNFASLLTSITSYIQHEHPKKEASTDSNDDPFSMLHGHMGLIKSVSSGENEGGDDQEGEPAPREGYNHVGDFWQRHFGDAKEASYAQFKEKFSADYSVRITQNFGADQAKLFENLMYKDIFALKHVMKKENYMRFVGEQQELGPDSFYTRLQAYVSSSLATRRVLDMDSTVRMTAIQQLASFKTPHVVKQLKTLTADTDPNIRAVSALALAKTGIKDAEIQDILINLLSNKDRLVRESACLSLAHMQSIRAMKKVLHVWRNDPISHVRQAAELALSRMGMDEAKEAMKITSVLTQEVTALKEASRQEVKS